MTTAASISFQGAKPNAFLTSRVTRTYKYLSWTTPMAALSAILMTFSIASVPRPSQKPYWLCARPPNRPRCSLMRLNSSRSGNLAARFSVEIGLNDAGSSTDLYSLLYKRTRLAFFNSVENILVSKQALNVLERDTTLIAQRPSLEGLRKVI